MTDQPKPYAVIGAGPMGLAAARNLQRFQIDFEGFEIHSDVGGLWDIDNPQSTMYESAHLISSKRMTEFSEYPMEDRVADYPSHHELKHYFQNFARHFNLNDHYHFNAKVIAVTRENGDWKIEYEQDGKTKSKVYGGVLIANGTLSEPNIPEFKGNFDGEMIHSAQYKSPDLFRDKRVLIVGAGNSGCDIAVDAIHYAESVDMSLRRGYHFVPKYVFGRPADAVGGTLKLPKFIKQRIDKMLLSWFVGDPTKFGFPEPDHKLYESHPIVNSLVLYHLGHGDLTIQTDIDHLEGDTVYFKDNTQADYDLILTATGYKLHYPFIDRSELNWHGAAPHLYLNCFHPVYDNLFMMGMVEASGLGWEGRYEQAELVARFILGCRNETPAAQQFRELKTEPFPDMRGGFNYIKLDRMAYYVHKDTYRNTVKKQIKALR